MRKQITLTTIGLLCLATLPFSQVNAQHDPLFSYYLKDPIAINPALAGTEHGLNMSLITRQQWVGIDGSPGTYSFGAHTPIPNQNMGLGLSILTDQAGPLRKTHFTGAYAYQITVIPGMKLSMGLRGGVTTYNASIGGLRVNDPSDPQFQSDDKQVLPSMGVGFHLYTDEYYAGLSLPGLFESAMLSSRGGDDEPFSPQIFLTGGYTFEIDRDWDILPSMLVGIMAGSPVSADVAVNARYQQQFYFGTHYRIGDAIGFLFSAEVYDQLIVGYSFDFSLNRLSNVQSGTHEFMLNYNLEHFWDLIDGAWTF